MARRKTKSSPGPYLLDVRLLRERIPSSEIYPFCLSAVRNLDSLDFHPKMPSSWVRMERENPW